MTEPREVQGARGRTGDAFHPSSWRPAQQGELGPVTKVLSRAEAAPRSLWTSSPLLVSSSVPWGPHVPSEEIPQHLRNLPRVLQPVRPGLLEP